MSDSESIEADADFKSILRIVTELHEEDTPIKYHKICSEWLERLKECTNDEKNSRNAHLLLFYQQLMAKKIDEPFNKPPPKGKLKELNSAIENKKIFDTIKPIENDKEAKASIEEAENTQQKQEENDVPDDATVILDSTETQQEENENVLEQYGIGDLIDTICQVIEKSILFNTEQKKSSEMFVGELKDILKLYTESQHKIDTVKKIITETITGILCDEKEIKNVCKNKKCIDMRQKICSLTQKLREEAKIDV